MRRVSAFDRDFHDLHGRAPPRSRIEVEIVHEQRLPVSRGLFGIVLGSLGLFWAIIFVAAVIAMLIGGGTFVWAMFHPTPYPGLS